jgi:hypothetical protein
MPRLPVPGSDNGTWGDVLNDYLAVAHDTVGNLKPNAVSSSVLQDDSISEAKLNVGSGANGQVLTKNSGLTGGLEWTSAAGSPDATASTKGLVQLAGDLSGTAAAPTVPGLANKANTSTTVSAGTGLTGGGDLSTNRTLSANFGTTAGTIAQGNDSRIAGAEQVANKGAASGYASLDGSTKVPVAQLPTGTSGSTVALGNHTHTLTFSLTSFFKSGVLTTTTGTQRLPIDGTYTIVGTRLMVGTAPTGSSLIVDVNKNGTTIYTTQGNRPTIAAASNAGGPGTAPDVTALAAGDYLTVDIDQVGSSVAGSDLTVSVIVTKTV